uniref:Uncharacterized protein n=1 Tax=Sphenodon punctatus TaxID=8508 RepID=A0A8D0HPC7_SPHPU
MQAVGTILPEEIQKLLEDVESYLVEGLQNENLSNRAKDHRETILFHFQQVKTRYHLEFLPQGGDQTDAFF